jgi:hypothetical protein
MIMVVLIMVMEGMAPASTADAVGLSPPYSLKSGCCFRGCHGGGRQLCVFSLEVAMACKVRHANVLSVVQTKCVIHHRILIRHMQVPPAG